MPAAFTRMPSGPSVRTAPAIAASTSSQRLTSAWMNVARPPALVMAAAVSLPPSGSRSTTATGAPACASAVAMPRPSPEPPPVTIAQPATSALTRATRCSLVGDDTTALTLSCRPPGRAYTRRRSRPSVRAALTQRGGQDASDPPSILEGHHARHRRHRRGRLPARRPGAGTEAGRVVEQGLLSRRRRRDAEDREGVREPREGRGRPLLHRAGGPAQEDQRRAHRAPRARRRLLLLQRLAGGAEVRLVRPARRLLGRRGRAQAPLQREDARGRPRAERQDEEARLLRRAH